MNKDERIRGLVAALNAIADTAEGVGDIHIYRLAQDAIQTYGDAIDNQRGLFGEVA